LCFILSAHSDSAEDLKKTWRELCGEGLTQMVPQSVVSLDTGYLYSGARKWPAPRFPANYVEPDDVHAETGVYAGLGLAWLITQHQGRLAATKHQAIGPITRFARLLDQAMMRKGVPPTYSARFDPTLWMRDIAGVFGWGSVTSYAHNRLQLCSLRRNRNGATAIYEIELFQAGTDMKSLSWPNDSELLRWFRYGKTHVTGKLLGVEEWLDHKAKTQHRRRIAVFDTVSGEEIIGPDVDALNDVSEVETLRNRYG
jgi:hypothetical protein